MNLKARVHEICESVRDEYLLTALEESENLSEKEILKMKKFLNESLNRIEKMLVEEGYVELGKAMIEEAFKVSDRVKDYGKAGLGAAAGAAGAMYGPQAVQYVGQKASELANAAGEKINQFANTAKEQFQNIASQAQEMSQELIDKMQENLGEFAGKNQDLLIQLYKTNPDLAHKIAFDPDFARGFLQGAIESSPERFQDALNTIDANVHGMTDFYGALAGVPTLQDKISELADKAQDYVSNLG